mgnify:CR=1 FL=1
MRASLQTEIFEYLGDHPVRQAAKLLSYARAQTVPNLELVRRIQSLKRQLERGATLQGDDPFLASLTWWLFLWYGANMLDMISQRRPPGARPTDASIRRITREIGKSPYFRSLNQKLRKYSRIFGRPTPHTFVVAHCREGFEVRGHIRYLGNDHLAHLPVGRYPEFVGRVVKVLMTQRTYGVFGVPPQEPVFCKLHLQRRKED